MSVADTLVIEAPLAKDSDMVARYMFWVNRGRWSLMSVTLMVTVALAVREKGIRHFDHCVYDVELFNKERVSLHTKLITRLCKTKLNK